MIEPLRDDNIGRISVNTEESPVVSMSLNLLEKPLDNTGLKIQH